MSSLFIIGIGYTTTSSAALILVTIAISLTAFGTSGAPVNIVEIAPKYSGILMGIINFACNITGFICPQVVGALTEHGVSTKLLNMFGVALWKSICGGDSGMSYNYTFEFVACF